MHGKGDGHFAAVDATFEFAGATDAANEVDARVAAQVGDAEDGGENLLGKHRDIEPANRVLERYAIRTDDEVIPCLLYTSRCV